MNYTLHLTNACNMQCGYCYITQKQEYMTAQTAQHTVQFAAKTLPQSCGIVFYGGEPLLCKELIYQTVEYCRHLEQQIPTRFHFKLTTNGMLLDQEFLEFSGKENILIAISHDGTQKAHDFHRKDHDSTGTYHQLERIIPSLLAARPYAPVMMTISPETVGEYAEGVKALWNKGFRYIICTLNYSGEWTVRSLHELKKQYKELADFYYELTKREEKFYLSPFDIKIGSRIQEEGSCQERCELGRKQLSVSPDGCLFPCIQFAGHAQYCIGDVESGIDEDRKEAIFHDSEKIKSECIGCAIISRCNCRCGCLNFQATGSISHVPPVLCRHERLLMPIADRLAEKLYKEKNGMFIQKHYNNIFPIISLVEDLKQ